MFQNGQEPNVGNVQGHQLTRGLKICAYYNIFKHEQMQQMMRIVVLAEQHFKIPGSGQIGDLNKGILGHKALHLLQVDALAGESDNITESA
jgi:hypothetical protein